MRSVFAQALELHRAKGLPVREQPTAIEPEEVYLRARLMGDEFFEVLEAMTGRDWSPEQFDLREELKHADLGGGDLRKIALELADLAMTVAGTALHYGLHLDALAEEVHRSNMEKEGGPGKLTKPDGWEPPDAERALAGSQSAWEREETVAGRAERTIADGTRDYGKDHSG